MRYRILSVLLLIVGILTSGAQNNTLTIPSVTTSPGQVIELPVNLDNTANVVAVQFTLSVPDGIDLRPASAALTERAKGLDVVMRQMGAGKYMAMIYSATNQVIRGRTGTLMTVPLTVTSDLQEGKSYKMTLSNVVIGIIDGSNVVTGYDAGSVTIAKSTDLEVSEVSTNVATIVPGDEISVNWQVTNLGGQPTGGGWSEQVYLVGADDTEKLISTVYQESALNAGAVISRSTTIVVPDVLGIDGEARIKVRLVPNSSTGEPSWLLGNNSATTSDTVDVVKRLRLNPDVLTVDESSAGTIRMLLTRSGNTEREELFYVDSTVDPRIAILGNVVIPPGQSGVYIYPVINADGGLNDNSVIDIKVSGEGYESVVSTLNIIDDTLPGLEIICEKDEVMEGESFKLVIEAERAPAADTEIKLICENPSRFEIPEILLPAGQTRVEVTIATKDDDVPDATKSIAFTSSATGYSSDTYYIELLDNDIPALELSLTPDAVSEAAGPTSIIAKLSRIDNIDKRVTIKFSDDSDGNIYYSRQTVEMAPGVKEITVTLGPVDNALVDGERTYNVSASVWFASCSCSAGAGESGGTVTVPVTVYDNDGASLSVKPSTSVIKEGEEIEVTVTRNTESSKPLTVNVTTDHESQLEYPSTVTIPEGQTSATFIVKSIEGEGNDDGFTAVLTVESEGFAKANTWFMVTDQTLPDAQITSLEVIEGKCEAGGTVTLSVTIENTGSYVLPELTKVGFYIDLQDKSLADAYLQESLPAGESVTVTKSVTLPENVGAAKLFAIVNDGQTVKELSYTNNSSPLVNIDLLSPYNFSVYTDKQVYMPNETVSISGRAEGKQVAYREIDLYIVNGDYRDVKKLATDADGNFSYTYQPYEGLSGYFTVGACYPGADIKETMASFDVYGIKRAANGAITVKGLLGEDYEGRFAIINPGRLAVSNVKAEVVSKPANCEVEVSCPTSIAGDESANVDFKITPLSVSEGDDWQKIVLKLTTNEGASLTTTLYYYCYMTTGKLRSSVSTIKTTMTKGEPRDYPFEISNVGKGETGEITFALPEWITVATGKEMASLAPEETATVVLRFNPTDNMQLNVPVTGHFGINCGNGKGLAIPFSVEPVSEATGTLTVDVCDEYTYYTAEAPHLQGAEVKVTHPTTGALIASGTTDENGKYSVQLNEGYYAVAVTAENHDGYRNNLLVDPGKEKVVTVNLSLEAITVDWTVEETEVEDEYKIVTKVEFETNVPTPVVEVNIPQSIPAKQLAEGESLIFNAVLTNHGLITAQDVKLSLPTGFSTLVFEQLACQEPFELAPHQSVLIPVKVTHLASPQLANARSAQARSVDNDPCSGDVGTIYFWQCGADRKMHRVGVAMQLGKCSPGTPIHNPTSPSTYNPWGGLGFPTGPGGGPGGFIGGGRYGYEDYIGPIKTTSDDCHPYNPNSCLPKALVGCGASAAGCFTGGLANIATCGVSIGMSCTEVSSWWGVANCGLAIGGCIPGPVGCGIGIAGCLSGIAQCLVENNSQHRIHAFRAPGFTGDQMLTITANLINLARDRYLEIMGDEVWLNVTHDDLSLIMDYVDTHINDDNELIIDADWESVKPENISKADMLRLLERFANTALVEQGKSVAGNNYANLTALSENLANSDAQQQVIYDMGYSDSDDFSDDLYLYLDELVRNVEEEASQSVCSSITLQFEQRMVLTRQAFRGTLTVTNGNTTTAMTDVKLNLKVTDKAGNVATSHEFQINPESINGFAGELDFDSGWSLDPTETGVLKVLFIPTKYAAPMEEQLYDFGGTLSYVDPFTGLVVTRELSPITLTVKPSPNLDLTYFMQRDIYGDDPLTEAIEPSVEAEFSLLINNLGYGDATNVRMTTDQPKIVENEKGLLIDFELISSQLNGGEKTLALGGSVATDFGTIPAKSTAYAQWWIKSSLLGHFTDYNVEATHVTSYDNPDLTLLNDVTIHELIRSIEVKSGDDTIVGFMTNDIPDAADAPDMMYLSNGEIEPVAVTGSASIRRVSDTDYELIVTPSASGWNYGRLSDPTYGVVKLNKVVRQSDGKELSVRNFWLTDRTLRDGKDPLYENLIHFVDNFSDLTAEKYTLTFEPMPELLLEVVSIEGVPDEGTVAHSPVEQLQVTFNKPVDATTFDADDITLSVQGERQDASLISITTQDNKTFVLDFTELNKTTGNGYYVFTVQTNDITDSEGFTGKEGKSVGWNMYVDGLILIQTSVNPEDAGTISGNRNVQYGETAMLMAEPAEGYTFSHWTVNGTESTRELQWNEIVLSEMSVVANFIENTYNVSVDSSTENGEIRGAQTGIYPHGQELTFTAVADDDYKFDCWILNDVILESDEPALSIVVTHDTTVSARFKYVGQYYQSLSFAPGWNWISYYLDPALNVRALMADENLARVLSQSKEMVRDPELGVIGTLTEISPMESYKVEATDATSIKFSSYDCWDASASILVRRGWNWLGYPLSRMLSVSEAFAGTSAETLDIIVGQDGFAQFDGENWIGTLEVMTPGLGYMFNSQSEKHIIYPVVTPATSNVSTKYPERASQNTGVDIHKYMSVMPVIAIIEGADNEPLNAGNYQVTAYCGNECRGIGRVVNGLVMMNVYGVPADKITFCVTDNMGVAQDVNNPALSFSETVVGNLIEPYVISTNIYNDVRIVYGNCHVSVSVIEDMLIIRGIAHDDIDHVEVFDIDGHKLLDETNISESGIRISQLGSGVYIVTVYSTNDYTNHKIVIR